MLTFPFYLGIFILISGYFLGLTSTDMVAVVPAPVIDSLDQFLFDPFFKDMRAVIPGGLWQESILKGSPNDSKEGMLYQKVEYKIHFRLDDPTELQAMIQHSINRLFNNDGIFVTDLSAMLGTKSAICQMRRHENGSRVHISRGETFGERLITFSVSKSSTQELKSWVNYRQSLLLQSGLTLQWTYKTAFDNQITDFSPHQIIKCLWPIKDDQKVPEAIRMKFFTSIFILFPSLFKCSFFVLFIEIFLFRVHKLLKRLADDQ